MIEHKQYSNGFKYIEVTNAHASAKIALQGAHIFEYKAVDKPALLWCSQKAYFEKGKAIRGGIPLCFPWFGKHEDDSSLPQHGFARTSLWDVVKEEENEEGITRVRLQLSHSEESLKLWAYKFEVCLDVVVGETLKVSLHIKNIDAKPFKVSTALHTYFAISDISSIVIEGLENAEYYDALRQRRCREEVSLRVDEEIDRVYETSTKPILLHDNTNTTKITSKGSNSLVVWNPWKEKSRTMSDMTEEGYKSMFCLETANAREDVRWIEPFNTHSLSVKYMQKRHE